MKILAIETSCDETALALVEATGGIRAPKFKVLESAIASQIKVHIPFGGVVPNLAKREHLRNLPILFGKIAGISNFQFPISKKLLNSLNSKSLPTGQAGFILNSVDLIAVTVGPGLEPALWTGIEFVKKLGKEWGKPVVGTNHMHGHLYSFLLPKKGSRYKLRVTRSMFPAIALLVSGGHTILLRMDSLQSWKKLGETRDDAVGEAFDKVARILNLPYPGGPEIEKIAKLGNPHAIEFPRPMIKDKNYDFSFSGLKTAVLYYVRDLGLKAKSSQLKAHVSASFQEAAVDVLTAKTMRAVKEFGAKSVFLAGGVAANKYLRNRLSREAKKNGANFFAPDFKYNTDNAAMIAAAAYMQTLNSKKKSYQLVARGDMGI